MNCELQTPFRRACTDYRLLEDGDRILVAVSGGKDSLLLCRLLAQQARIYRPNIHVEAAHVVMDGIPYRTDLDWLHRYCNELGIALHILHAQFPTTTKRGETPCRQCALTRRRTLFNFATEHAFNKVALGHHQDDILVTLLLNLTFEGSASSMQPSMAMQHYPITIIRPLCLCREADIAAWARAEAIPEQLERCPHEQVTRRSDMEKLFHQLEALNPEARHSMWHALNAAGKSPLRDGKKEVKGVIFDLDGTLLDTLQDLFLATNHALRTHGMPERTLEEVRQFVGNGVRKLIERATPDGEANPRFDDIFAEFKRYYVEHCHDNTRLYPGVAEMLKALKARGIPMAIVSNKLQAGVTELHQRWFTDTISVAIGEHEGVRRKPAPDMVELAIESLGVKREEVVYVGDSEVDIQTAVNAHIPCLSVLWGFRNRDFLEAHDATTFIAHPNDILSII